MLDNKQKRLTKDIEEISAICSMDHWNILEYSEGSRTSRLTETRDQLIRSEIVKSYVLVDEILNLIICETYFKRPGVKFKYDAMWRTKKPRAFMHHVLDNLYLLNKTKLVHELKPIPKQFRDSIDRLNGLRNAVAHSLFPASRYQYREYKKVMFRGNDIFSVTGFKNFR